MPAWIAFFDLSLMKWAVWQPNTASRFAPTVRLIAITAAVLLSLALWGLIIAVFFWLLR
jgi:hypothetical protein